MKVECVVPEGAVLFRKLPTKKEPSQSKLVEGAFVHTFVLTSGKVNVIARMHVKVRQRQLQDTNLWKVRVLHVDGLEVALLLLPAAKDAIANFSEIKLRESGSRSFEMQFCEYKPRALKYEANLTHLERRLRLAQHEAQRI